MKQKRANKQPKQPKQQQQQTSKDIEAVLNQQQQQSKQQQQQQLLSDINGKNSNSKMILAQEEEILSKNKMTYCLKGRWILLLSMTLFLIITAILVAILTISLLDNEDQCFNQNYQFHQPSYKLFATKTTYSNTYQYLNYSRSELPNIFSKSDSLKTLNDKLTSPTFSNCKVRQFHYFGRHAARFPNKKTIEELNKLIKNVQIRIDLSKFSTNTNNSNNNSSRVCFNPLTQYKQWMSFMLPEQGNLIMESGAIETQALALRLKSIHPILFNSSETKIEFGTTNELRTAQTAIVFLKEVDNFPLDFCSLDQFPTDNLSSSFKADELNRNDCYKQFIKKYQRDNLQFHKRCESYHKEEFVIPLNFNLKDPNRTKFIATSVSKKLKLPKEDYLTPEETEAIYKLCKYETALTGSSIWCNLFSDDELKFYEYLNDLDDFFHQAYGNHDQARSACPITNELLRSFKTARGTSKSQLSSTPEANFYFTHSEVIQKILAASVDLESDPEYSKDIVLSHLQDGTTPKSRSWRTSLFTPFSANLAFTLYDCPQKTPTTNNNNFMEFDVSEGNFKVVASLNEQPILLEGCSSHVCDLNQLLDEGRIFKERACKLDVICRKNIVYT